MDKYVFVVEMQNTENFKDIFGRSVVFTAQKDLTNGFKDIANQLLMQHNILSEISSPEFGLWYVFFSFKQSEFSIDVNGQIEALTAAGKEIFRTMFQKNFGMATGTNLDYKVAALPVPDGISDIESIKSFIITSLKQYKSAGKPYTAISLDEFKKIIYTRSIDIYLQPIVSLPQETIVGYEALSRGPVNSPVHQAADLFGTASHFGLTDELEMTCILNALDWAKKLPEPYWLSINIGPKLIASPNFHDLIYNQRLKEILSRIIFEITEHLPIPMVERLKKVVHNMKELGIRLALDDTGCGFANMKTVQFLRPDIVKLCITVIRRIGHHPNIEKDICLTVDKISQYKADVLGEGVERKEESDVLKNCKVPLAQGYYYGRPMPAKDLKGVAVE